MKKRRGFLILFTELVKCGCTKCNVDDNRGMLKRSATTEVLFLGQLFKQIETSKPFFFCI